MVMRELRAEIVKVTVLSFLIMQMGFNTLNCLGYVAKPRDTIAPSLTVTGINETAGLELAMQIKKTLYSQGETVSIMFTLTNISNRTVSFWMTAWTFDFQVSNGTDHRIFQYSTSQVFPQVIWNASIRPGSNLTDVLVWPQTCNTTEGVLVSPATYYINGLIWSIDSLILRTPPLQITVVKLDPFSIEGGGGGGPYHCYAN